MAVAEEEQTEQQDGSSAARTALVAAAAAAATGAAAIAARKALSHDDDDDSSDDDDGGDDGESMVSKLRPSKGKLSKNKGKSDMSSMLGNVASSAWDSAQGVILPMAEDAVAAAGKYLAEEAPEIVRERLVPRFIEAFNDAS
jgi:hypothetical protein